MAYQPNTWNPLDIITSEKLNDIEQGVLDASEKNIYGHGGALQPSDGIHSMIYIKKGEAMPSNPQPGDTVFIVDGDNYDDYTIVEWNGEQWVTRLDPQLSERIDKVLTDAKAQSEQLISDNNTQINQTIDEVTKEKIELALKDADFNAQAQAMADKALSDAKANTATVAQETLDSANQNITQAKSDITDAYKTADGVIDKKIDDTASSITTTINQNKTDADGKISSAQSTATQALNEVSTKVSQTDYDTKTGDLDTRVTKAQTTADGAVTTVGNYQTSNDARVKAAETKISQNANDITLRATTTDLNNVKADYNAQIAQVKVDAGKVETSVSELNDKVNSLGQINQLFNTEFSPDFAGWYPGTSSSSGSYVGSTTLSASDGWSMSSEKYNGSNVINFSVGNVASFYSNLIPVGASTPVSVSMSAKSSSDYTGTVTLAFYLRYYDANKNYISQKLWNSNKVTSWSTFNLTDTTPANTAYIVFNIVTNGGAGTNSYSQPMMVFSSTVGDYVQGNYNNNDKIASQQVTIDGITDTVSKQGTNIDSVTKRVTTAEGTLTTATNNITGLQTKQTTTANQVTQEIADRKTGDNNTLQSSKDFTQSSITNYDKGVQSQITQTASGILAQVESTNMVVNSEFDPLNGTFYRLTNGGATGSQLAEAWNAPQAHSFEDWSVVNGSRLISYATSNWYSTALAPSSAGKIYSASIVAGRSPAPTVSTALDYRIGFWDSSRKLLTTASAGNIIDGTATKGIQKYVVENQTAPANTAFVSVIIAHSSANAIDFITRPSLNTGTKASPYTPTYGNTSSSTILSLFKDNYSFGISDDGKLISGLVGNEDSLVLKGKSITLDNDTNVTGDFYAKGGNFKNINAANIVGTNASFFQANFVNAYGHSVDISADGMTVYYSDRYTEFNGNGVIFKQLVNYADGTSGLESIGSLVTSYKGTANMLMTAVYDQTYKSIGSPTGEIWGGDMIGWGRASDLVGNYDSLFTWSNGTAASVFGTSFGFNFYDRINFNQNEIVSGGNFNFLMSSTKFGSGYFGGKAVPSISATWSGNTGGGIAFGNDNVIIFAPGKTKIIL